MWSEMRSCGGELRSCCDCFNAMRQLLARRRYRRRSQRASVGSFWAAFLKRRKIERQSASPNEWVRQAARNQVSGIPVADTDRKRTDGAGRYGFNWWACALWFLTGICSLQEWVCTATNLTKLSPTTSSSGSWQGPELNLVHTGDSGCLDQGILT